MDVKVVEADEAALAGEEADVEDGLEGGVARGAEEEGVSGHEVEGGDEEADGLHHVP